MNFEMLVAAMGGLVTDDAVVDLMAAIGKKSPTSATTDSKDVEAKKFGLELVFEPEIYRSDLPLVKKTKRSFVPRLGTVWIGPKFPGSLPDGIRADWSTEEIASNLGEPTHRVGKMKRPVWRRPVNDRVFLELGASKPLLRMVEGRHLRGPDVVSSLFAHWLVSRGLGGPELGEDIDASIARGFWTTHVAAPHQDDTARYFLRLRDDGRWLMTDLIEQFGAVEGPHGHDLPDLPPLDEALVARVDRLFAEALGL